MPTTALVDFWAQRELLKGSMLARPRLGDGIELDRAAANCAQYPRRRHQHRRARVRRRRSLDLGQQHHRCPAFGIDCFVDVGNSRSFPDTVDGGKHPFRRGWGI